MARHYEGKQKLAKYILVWWICFKQNGNMPVTHVVTHGLTKHWVSAFGL